MTALVEKVGKVGRLCTRFILLVLRIVRGSRTLRSVILVGVASVFWRVPHFAQSAGFARQTEPVAPGAEFTQFAVFAGGAVLATVIGGAGGTRE